MVKGGGDSLVFVYGEDYGFLQMQNGLGWLSSFETLKIFGECFF
jgi:hypothetical protein